MLAGPRMRGGRVPVRENEDGADFFIYPDKAPKDVIWCFVSTGHTDARPCQRAGTEPRTMAMWTEAWRRVRLTRPDAVSIFLWSWLLTKVVPIGICMIPIGTTCGWKGKPPQDGRIRRVP